MLPLSNKISIALCAIRVNQLIENSNDCHDESGKFCSEGGGSGGKSEAEPSILDIINSRNKQAEELKKKGFGKEIQRGVDQWRKDLVAGKVKKPPSLMTKKEAEVARFRSEYGQKDKRSDTMATFTFGSGKYTVAPPKKKS